MSESSKGERMGDLKEIMDPRVKGFETKAKVAGAAVVAIAAGVIAAVAGATLIVGGIAIVGGVVAVNVVPVVTRRMALWKQSKLTQLAEEFSEETIREDERKEDERLAEQQQLYTSQSAQFGNVIDELRSNMSSATSEERELLQGQIDQLEGVLKDAEASIAQKVADLAELRRVNKIFIGLHRAASVMSRSQDLKRNAEEIQRIETARNAIKTRMREALAGQKLEAMNAPLQQRLSVAKVVQIGSSSAQTLQPNLKENVNALPNHR